MSTLGDAVHDRGSIGPAELEGILISVAKTYKEHYKNMPAKPGLRMISFSGDLLYGAFKYDQAVRFIQEMLDQLPPDATVMNFGGDAIRTMPAYRTGAVGFHDAYAIIFASAEWMPVDEGELIPELKLTFNRS